MTTSRRVRKPRPLTPVPTSRQLQPGMFLTRAEVSALLASRLLKRGEEVGTARDRFRKMVAEHVEKGSLKEAAPRRIVVGELARWARPRWPKKFDDCRRTIGSKSTRPATH
jgi:hypothetical protein